MVIGIVNLIFGILSFKPSLVLVSDVVGDADNGRYVVVVDVKDTVFVSLRILHTDVVKKALSVLTQRKVPYNNGDGFPAALGCETHRDHASDGKHIRFFYHGTASSLYL